MPIVGVVTEVTARHEGASFGSDVFLISDGVLPARVQETAEITTTRVEPECYVPPATGRAGQPRDRHRAGRTRCTSTRWTASCRSASAATAHPIYINLDFLDGTRGAHISISGISGVATKTSLRIVPAALHLSSGVLGSRARQRQGAGVLGQGRGPAVPRLREHPARTTNSGRHTRTSGCPPGPFASVGFYSPPTPDDLTGKPHVTGRTSGVEPFWWTLAEFCRANCCRTCSPTPRTSATSTRWSSARSRPGCGWTSQSRPARTARSASTATPAAPTSSWSTSSSTGSPTTPPARNGPVRSPASGTINAFIRRLRSSLQPLRALIRGDLPDTGARQISTGNQQVTVVDLHNLRERAQRFVVGVVLAAETARKEAAGPGSLLFTMIDELNKYAPREGNSPIKDVLLDIAERGRSLGIILIGAQQTASEVERRIVVELAASRSSAGSTRPRPARPEYGFLPPSQRTGPPSPSRAPCSSASRRSRCRCRSSSPSPPGRPGRPNAERRRPRRRTGRPRRRSSGCRRPSTTRRRSDDAPLLRAET